MKGIRQLKNNSYLKYILVFLVVLFTWFMFSFFIIGMLRIVPCIRIEDKTWWRCPANGIMVSKLTFVYFDSVVLERLYQLIYLIVAPVMVASYSVIIYSKKKNAN